jgi:hypothetical protein
MLSCDAEFTDWMGYKHEDLTGKPLVELFVPSARAAMEQ